MEGWLQPLWAIKVLVRPKTGLNQPSSCELGPGMGRASAWKFSSGCPRVFLGQKVPSGSPRGSLRVSC